LDIPADDEYAPMIIRAPMLMNDTPYVFPRDDISAIEFHPEIDTSPIFGGPQQLRMTYFPVMKFKRDDTTGAVFGFHYRRMDSVGSTNGHRYTLTKKNNDSAYYKVLAQPVASAELTRLTDPYIENTPHLTHGSNKELNGTHHYLSINVRRTESTDTLMNNDTVLVIAMPRRIKAKPFDTLSIIFDSVAIQNLSVDTLPFGRGISLKLRKVQAGDSNTLFVITRAMLPRGDAAEKDITINAFFKLKSNLGDTSTPNAPLQHIWSDRKDGEIDELGLDVQYKRNSSSIAIDWFRIAVPFAHKMMMGYYDTVHIARMIGWMLQHYKTARTGTNRPNARLMAIYGEDEPWYSTALAQAYLSRILKGRWLNYAAGQEPLTTMMAPRYRWMPEVPTASKVRWGTNAQVAYVFDIQPLKNKFADYDTVQKRWVPNNANRDDWDRVMYPRGWGSMYFGSAQWDTNERPSTYEIQIRATGYHKPKPELDSLFHAKFHSVLAALDTNETKHTYFSYHIDPQTTPFHKYWLQYPNYLVENGIHGPQPAYESWCYHNYVLDSSIYLSRQLWWTNIWLGSNWSGSKISRKMTVADTVADVITTVVGPHDVHPQTGEEVRLQIWGALIHGCKGLMFERFHNDPILGHSNTIRVDSSSAANYGCIEEGGADSAEYAQWGDRLFDTAVGKTGGDFLNDSSMTKISSYISLNELGSIHKVRPDRVYIGRLSTRYVVKSITDLIGGSRGIGDTLMHLHLKAWYGKGYEENRIGDIDLMKKYISIDTSIGTVRQIGRHKIIGGDTVPDYERSDSTFFDITMLEYDSTNSNSMVYIGIQNRRTSPFVWLPKTDSLAQNRPDTLNHPTNPNLTLTFLTTVEFNKYVQQNKLHRYAQTGSREISIPFQYKDSSGKYALFRIRELRGKDTATISKAPPIDTIIGQDGRLTALYQPGEGRIFRVEKLSTTDFKGELAFSNQNKICSYPLMRKDLNNKWIESDSLCYYATYHKIIDSTIDRWGVYFRMSYPGKKQAGSQIKWHNREYLLSDSIHYLNYGITRNDTCAYPSIVVRFNPDSQAYHAFIVYGCLSELRSPLNSVQALNEAKRQYIVESIVNIVQDSVVLPAYAIALDSVMDMQRRLNVYGTPMISAADSANFYTYSDINRGIVACWKYPSTNPGIRNYFRDSIYFSFKGNAKPYGALHPSLNSYSRGFNGAREQSSSLVWQEALDSLSVYQIYYTRLWTDDSAHIHFGLGQLEDTSSTMPPLLFNANKTIACLSSSRLPFIECRSHTMPVVYRELYIPPYSYCDYNDTIPTLGRLRLENIAWQTWQCNTDLWNYIPIPYSSISRRFVFSSDTAVQGRLHPASLPYSPGVNTIDPVLPILGIAENYDQPVLQGGNASNISSYCFNTSWRGLALQFRRSQSWLYKLQHLEMPPIAPAPPVNAIVELSDWGNLGNGHLSAHPNLKVDDWFILRRLYEKKQGSPLTGINYIRNSSEKFARTIEERTRHFCGYGDEYSDMTFEGIAIGDQYYPIGEPVAESTWQLALPKAPPDTLFTDWFRLDTGRVEAILYSSGITSNQIWCYLERRWDGLLYPIEYVEGAGITESALYFENGNNEEYRLKVWPRNKENSIYRDRTFITTSLPGGLSKRSESTKKAYGLSLHNSDQSGILTVYPNPAEEYIIIRAGHSNAISEPYQIELSDAMGRRQIIGQIQSGMSVQYPTTTLSSGRYTVRLLQPAQKTIPIVQVMIIK
jgi:hypothetical protein